jgi:hypothetical protein
MRSVDRPPGCARWTDRRDALGGLTAGPVEALTDTPFVAPSADCDVNRRQFLATATATSALPLAGCASVGVATTDLGAPETRTERGDAYLTFARNDERLLSFSVMPREDDGDRIPLWLDAWHASDTRLDSFRVAVRAPADGRDPTTDIYLKTPWFGDGRSLDFHRRDDGRTTVVAADDLGEDGEATLSIELLLDPTETPASLPVGVSGAFEFSERGLLGRTYRAEGATTVAVGDQSSVG